MRKCDDAAWDHYYERVIDCAGWPGIDLTTLRQLVEGNDSDHKHRVHLSGPAGKSSGEGSDYESEGGPLRNAQGLSGASG
jgi:hypothetical protein